MHIQYFTDRFYEYFNNIKRLIYIFFNGTLKIFSNICKDKGNHWIYSTDKTKNEVKKLPGRVSANEIWYANSNIEITYRNKCVGIMKSDEKKMIK